MNSKGFTLIELMVYIALTSIVLVIAGMVFTTTLQSNKDIENQLKALALSDDAFLNIVNDIGRTGTKLQFVDAAYTAVADVALGITDLSSYTITRNVGSNLDILTFRTAIINANGSSEGVETVRYFFAGDTLKRTSTLNMIVTNQVVATHISGFKIEEGFVATDTIYPSVHHPATTLTTLRESTTSGLTMPRAGVVSNFPMNAWSVFGIGNNADLIPLGAIGIGDKYRYEVRLGFNASFVENFNKAVDTVQFVVYNNSLVTLPGARAMNIVPVSADTNFFIYEFSAANAAANSEYSPRIRTRFGTVLANREIFIANPMLIRTSAGIYNWRTITNNIAEKRFVKAFRLTITTNVNNKTKEKTKIIPIPNNGI